MEPGARPFRSVVGVDMGVRALNDAVHPHEAALLATAGLTAFTTLATAPLSEATPGA
jgi:hypothetical protein